MSKKDIQPLFDENYRNKKIEELHSLSTSLDKVQFWFSDLKLNWFNLYDSSSFYELELKPFKFTVPDNEKKEFNEWIIENYLRLASNPNRENYFQLDILKANFELELKSSNNVNASIQIELRRIDSSFKRHPSNMKGMSSYLNNVEYNNTFYVDPKFYHDYLNYGLDVDYSEVYPFPSNVIRARNAIVLAMYRQYVETRLEIKPELNTVKQIDLTLNQITLLLNYCGVWDSLDCDVSEKARLFEPFIQSDSSKRIYDSIRESGAKKRKTKEDLEAILSFMESRKIKSFQKKIKEDFQKLHN
jgi:hypothetical protein